MLPIGVATAYHTFLFRSAVCIFPITPPPHILSHNTHYILHDQMTPPPPPQPFLYSTRQFHSHHPFSYHVPHSPPLYRGRGHVCTFPNTISASAPVPPAILGCRRVSAYLVIQCVSKKKVYTLKKSPQINISKYFLENVIPMDSQGSLLS